MPQLDWFAAVPTAALELGMETSKIVADREIASIWALSEAEIYCAFMPPNVYTIPN